MVKQLNYYLKYKVIQGLRLHKHYRWLSVRTAIWQFLWHEEVWHFISALLALTWCPLSSTGAKLQLLSCYLLPAQGTPVMQELYLWLWQCPQSNTGTRQWKAELHKVSLSQNKMFLFDLYRWVQEFNFDFPKRWQLPKENSKKKKKSPAKVPHQHCNGVSKTNFNKLCRVVAYSCKLIEERKAW